MSRLLRFTFLALLLSVAFTRADQDGWEKVDRASINFSVEDLTGAKLTEKALEGRIVVIDFWATWCGPCVQELPELARFAEHIKGRKDVAFLSFSVDDDKADDVKYGNDECRDNDNKRFVD